MANSRLDAIHVQHLGLLHYLTGNCAPAAASHQQALALYRQLGDRPAEACVLYYLGGVHRETGDYPAAIAMLWQARMVARSASDHLDEAVALDLMDTPNT